MSRLYDIVDYLEKEKVSQVIIDAFIKTQAMYNEYGVCNVSISGGADSDIMLDICTNLDTEHNMFRYYFINTGMEYEATRRHIKELEVKYDITIEQVRPQVSCKVICSTYGMPFISKQVSEYIGKLQAAGFQWTNDEKELKKLLKGAYDWWSKEPADIHKPPYISVYRNRYLKEFLMEYNPKIKISDKCCHFLKKKTSIEIYKQNKGVRFVGVRRAEGGARAKTGACFTNRGHGAEPMFRPLFWFAQNEIAQYKEIFGVTNSECYTKYGMLRTGCAGCPFSPSAEEELERVKPYEPGMYKLAHALFQDSYDYTRQYRQFVAEYPKMEAFKYLVRHPLLGNKNATHK